jgi:iron(III) transport system substrate-binding protein
MGMKMFRTERIRNVLLVCAMAGILCVFCGTASAAPVTLYTSQPDEDVESLLTAFNARHPGVEVQVFRSGTEEVVGKVMAEKMTGEVQADVLLLADSVTFDALKSANVLEPYRSPELAGIPEMFADRDGMYCGTKILATVLLVNTDKVRALPDSWKIMTSPAAKNEGFIASPLYSGAAAYQLGVLVRTDGIGWPYYEGLKANEVSVGKGNGGVITAVAGGEKAYGLVVDYMALRAKLKGSPVDFSYPKEGVTVVTEPIALVKKAEKAGKKSENADARLFVDFVLSEEGQKLVSSQGYTPVRGGITPPEGLKGVGEMKILDADPVLLAREREQDKKKFAEIFQ